MDFLKKHYEKIILSVVLLGVAIYAVRLLGLIDESKQQQEERIKRIIQEKGKDAQPVDFATYEQALKRLQTATNISLVGDHNLLNPVLWQRRQDGKIFRVLTGDELIREFVVTRITNLYYLVTYDGTTGSGDFLRYKFSLTDEAAVKPADRRKITLNEALTRKNPWFRLAEIKGPPDAPTELFLELFKDKLTISVGKGKESRRVVGYEADAKYDPEQKKFIGLRMQPQSQLDFAGDTYKVIAITESEVTIESNTTSKRWTSKLAR